MQRADRFWARRTWKANIYERDARASTRASTCLQSPNRWVLNKSIQMTPRLDWNRIMQRLLRAQRTLETDAPRTQSTPYASMLQSADARRYITKFRTLLGGLWLGYSSWGQIAFRRNLVESIDRTSNVGYRTKIRPAGRLRENLWIAKLLMIEKETGYLSAM